MEYSKQKVNKGIGKMTHSIKHLFFNHEDLSSDPTHHCKGSTKMLSVT